MRSGVQTDACDLSLAAEQGAQKLPGLRIPDLDGLDAFIAQEQR